MPKLLLRSVARVVLLTMPPSFWDENSNLTSALIWVILGGILALILRAAFEKLSAALVDALGKLGSGWGFKKRYLTHLIEEYKNLNIRGLRDLGAKTNAVELEHIYVSLQAQSGAALGRKAAAVSVGQALAQHRRLVIRGGPGSGKTTLMRYLTLTYARKQVKARLDLEERALPILVPLRQLRQVLDNGNAHTATTLPAYLAQYYVELGLNAREDFFERALEGGRCLVLLDGLDEVADEGERLRMSAWVDKLVARYPKNRYIVTSRPAGYEGAPLTNGFDVLDVRNLTEAEVRQFAQNWYLAVELAAQGEDTSTARRRARDGVRDLLAAIAANPNIRKLAVNPMLLTIIALVHRHRATLPKQRVELYRECVDVLLGHWDTAKMDVDVAFLPDKKRAVLQVVALALHSQGEREISRRALERQIAGLLPTVGGKAGDAGAFLDEIRDRSGLLVESGLNSYRFSHFTFQEYLCARELVEMADIVHPADVVQPSVPLVSAVQLHQTLDARFNDEELRDLCFELKVDHDNLPARNKKGKARELTVLFERQGKLDVLVAAVNRREDIVLSEIPVPESEPPLTLLLRHAGEGWWHEVFLLYAGMTDATPVVRALLDLDLSGFRQTEGLHNLTGLDAGYLLLTGRCVAEAARLDPTTRKDVLARLEDAFAACEGERFVEVGEVLAGIAGEDSVVFFLRVAHEDAERRDVALGALVEMARQPDEVLREQVIERLLATLDVEDYYQEAARVLCRVWEGRLLSEVQERQLLSSLGMVRVPEGTFLYGDDNEKHSLPEFWIDKTPVTNVEYAQFVTATGRKSPRHWKGETPPEDIADHPVTHVSWHDAEAYAEWAGKQLPTEEQWEKAARGTDGRQYPWGDGHPTHELCNYGGNEKGTMSVGQYSPQGDSPYGCVDMAGNVWEWTDSNYDDRRKVLRGGSWDYDEDDVRSTDRDWDAPTYADGFVGFRCIMLRAQG